MIHLSDECAYNRPGCPSATGAESQTGVNMQFLLRARDGDGGEGSCCAIDPSKGKGCRVVDLWNDQDGLQYAYNVGVDRRDLVRLRWSGTLEMTQVQAAGGSDDPGTTPLAGGLATDGPVECVPGPDGSCIGGDAAAAELVLDVDRAIDDGLVHEGGGETFFLFRALGENQDGFSSADTNVRLYLADETPPSASPACD